MKLLPQIAVGFLVTFLPAIAATSLSVEPSAVELGRQLQQTTVKREITLTNKGDRPLEILKVVADCGCTTTALVDKDLAPGASTRLTVQFETRTYVGDVRRRIQLTTQDGTLSLPLTAYVAPFADWDVTPLPLMIPPSLAGQPAQLNATLQHRGPSPATRIASVKTSVPWIEATLTETAERTQTLTLAKTPGAPAGTHSIQASLTPAGADAEPLLLNVIVPVASALRITPNPIVFPRSKTGEKASVSFRVIGWQGAAAPEIHSSRGVVSHVGELHGEHTFQLTWTPEAAGQEIWSVEVRNGAKTQMEASVIHRVTE